VDGPIPFKIIILMDWVHVVTRRRGLTPKFSSVRASKISFVSNYIRLAVRGFFRRKPRLCQYF
jgi:hypothetical protein